MSPWTVYPAIDLRSGQVVRLLQGDPNRQTIYDRDPAATASRWRDAGATWLHVIDLDAAFGTASGANQAALSRLLQVGMSIQLGGGLRTLDSIRTALNLGVNRVVLGTAAIESPAIVQEAISVFGPERIAVGLDLRGSKPQTHGWTQSADQPATSLARRWAHEGLRWLIHTDTDRDGTGKGINLPAAAQLALVTGMHVIASGGASSLHDVREAYRAGLAGIIVGRALYEGHVDLRAALAVASTQEDQVAG